MSSPKLLSTIAGIEYIRNHLSSDQQFELMEELVSQCRIKEHGHILKEKIEKAGQWTFLVDDNAVELDWDADHIMLDNTVDKAHITFRPAADQKCVINFSVQCDCDVYLPENAIPLYDPRHPYGNRSNILENETSFKFTYDSRKGINNATFYWNTKYQKWFEML